MGYKVIDMKGKKLGMLVVICRLPNKNGAAVWECLCKCGKTVAITGGNLRNGTKSCGCLQRTMTALSNKESGRNGYNTNGEESVSWSSVDADFDNEGFGA